MQHRPTFCDMSKRAFTAFWEPKNVKITSSRPFLLPFVPKKPAQTANSVQVSTLERHISMTLFLVIFLYIIPIMRDCLYFNSPIVAYPYDLSLWMTELLIINAVIHNNC